MKSAIVVLQWTCQHITCQPTRSSIQSIMSCPPTCSIYQSSVCCPPTRSSIQSNVSYPPTRYIYQFSVSSPPTRSSNQSSMSCTPTRSSTNPVCAAHPHFSCLSDQHEPALLCSPRTSWQWCIDEERLLLQVIVGYPQTKPLTSEEKDLVWKFRFYLSAQKKVSYMIFLSSAGFCRFSEVIAYSCLRTTKNLHRNHSENQRFLSVINIYRFMRFGVNCCAACCYTEIKLHVPSQLGIGTR